MTPGVVDSCLHVHMPFPLLSLLFFGFCCFSISYLHVCSFEPVSVVRNMFLFLALIFKRKPFICFSLQLGDVNSVGLIWRNSPPPPKLCLDNAPKRLLGKETFSEAEKICRDSCSSVSLGSPPPPSAELLQFTAAANHFLRGISIKRRNPDWVISGKSQTLAHSPGNQ